MLDVIVVSPKISRAHRFIDELRAETAHIRFASVHNADEALVQLARLPCAVVVFLFSQVNSGLYRGLRLAAACKKANAMVAGVPEDPAILLHCFEAGALNCALKHELPAAVIEKIQDTYKRRSFLSPELATLLVAHLAHLARQVVLPLHLTQPFSDLSPREAEVLIYLEQKLSNREIGKKMGITEGTVKNYVHRILRKLGVESRHQVTELLRLSMG